MDYTTNGVTFMVWACWMISVVVIIYTHWQIAQKAKNRSEFVYAVVSLAGGIIAGTVIIQTLILPMTLWFLVDKFPM